MKQTAVVIAPGRGTYNKPELGYLGRHHADKADLIAQFDARRTALGQDSISALDGAARFSGARHTRGDTASALIYACAYCDYLAIDPDRYDIIGVSGNSMGWYIALACGGALGAMDGFEVVNTMGTLMQNALIGGQIIYPFVDDDWQPIAGARDAVLTRVSQINARADHTLALSIELGGMLVLAGDEAGLSAFEREMPRLQDRFPMRLPNHAAFHTDLQAPVAEQGRAALGQVRFGQPHTKLVDGRGAIWAPQSSDTDALRGYTLGHQVTQPYDFTGALRVAARELCPDVFIVLGPRSTLGGATAQSLSACNWRGASGKTAFKAMNPPRLLNMGDEGQRALVC